MTSRERVRAALALEAPDRVPLHDNPWRQTIERWHREGLPEDTTPAEYFGYELTSIKADLSLQLPTEKIEETDEYLIERGPSGAVHRNWKGPASTPELVDFLIKGRSAWDEHKSRLAYNDGRVDWAGCKSHLDAAHAAGKFVTFRGTVGYDTTSAKFLGPVRLLTAMVDEPDWVREIFDLQAELVVAVVEELFARGFELDGGFLRDDLGYKNGLFFSPRAYEELLFPAHQRACAPFRSRGLPVILHSCGQVHALIPELLEAGFTCLQPLEVKAGMDLVELKKKYGDRLAFMGGIDVRVMASGDRAAIEEEIRTKVSVAKQGGGYVYHSDHSVPDNVSFESYRHVIEMVRKYGG